MVGRIVHVDCAMRKGGGLESHGVSIGSLFAPGLEALPALPVDVELQPRALSAYLGDFEMRPGFVLSFTELQGQLQVQATGQPRFPMFASAHDSFFTKAFESAVRFDAPGADVSTATATWCRG